MNAARIAHALRRGRKSGASWVASCPAHKDRNPSLSIRDAPDGVVLVHCHAGCTQTDVIASLKEMALWPENRKQLDRRRIVNEYNYTDERGELLYQILRTDPKGFFQRCPDGEGGWMNRKHPRQVLYRLPSVMKSPIVFICEGEKDVETMRSYGFVATTMAGGANARWLPTFTEALRGREVILVPDNDAAGWALMRRIADALLGQVARLVCFNDHHHAGLKDISDWFGAGHSETELVHLLEHGRCRSK